MDITAPFSTIPTIMIHSTGAIHMPILAPPIISGRDIIAGLIEVMPDTIRATTTILGQVSLPCVKRFLNEDVASHVEGQTSRITLAMIPEELRLEVREAVVPVWSSRTAPAQRDPAMFHPNEEGAEAPRDP